MTKNRPIENSQKYDYLEHGSRGITCCRAVIGMGCIGYQMEGV